MREREIEYDAGNSASGNRTRLEASEVCLNKFPDTSELPDRAQKATRPKSEVLCGFDTSSAVIRAFLVLFEVFSLICQNIVM